MPCRALVRKGVLCGTFAFLSGARRKRNCVLPCDQPTKYEGRPESIQPGNRSRYVDNGWIFFRTALVDLRAVCLPKCWCQEWDKGPKEMQTCLIPLAPRWPSRSIPVGLSGARAPRCTPLRCWPGSDGSNTALSSKGKKRCVCSEQ